MAPSAASGRAWSAWFFLLTLLFATAAPAQKKKGAGPPDFSGLDTAFARVLKEWHAAGFAVAVVKKDQVIFSLGKGWRDVERKLPVTPQTVFAIGSCTKAFTASLIGQLGQEGLVSLDQPVRTYLPELRFFSEDLTEHVTLRDLMCHRTGLPRHDLSWYYFRTPSRDSLLQRIAYMEPTAGLRQKWQYNNFMFLLQGMVAERLRHQSWEDLIRSRFFQPLGMTHSCLSIEELQRSAEPAVGYEVGPDSLPLKMNYYPIGAMGPAGSINSTVEDMAQWLMTWIAQGKYQGKEILPAGYVTEAMSPQMVIPGGLPSRESPDLYFANYGFGWFLSSYRGHYRVEHGGNIDGFSASVCFFPSDSLGIVVLSNQNNSQVPSVVRNLLADRLLHLPYIDWQTRLKSAYNQAVNQGREAQQSKVSPGMPAPATHKPEEYEGSFRHAAYGTAEVYRNGDSLMLRMGTFRFWLRHDRYDLYTLYPREGAGGPDTSNSLGVAQFNMNSSGEITSLSLPLEPTLAPLLFQRVPGALAADRSRFPAYAGEYTLSSVVIRVTVSPDSTLHLAVPGQPEYELVPEGRDRFMIRNLSGFFIQFERNDQGEIIDLLSIQPNGTFKAIRKK